MIKNEICKFGSKSREVRIKINDITTTYHRFLSEYGIIQRKDESIKMKMQAITDETKGIKSREMSDCSKNWSQFFRFYEWKKKNVKINASIRNENAQIKAAVWHKSVFFQMPFIYSHLQSIFHPVNNTHRYIRRRTWNV